MDSGLKLLQRTLTEENVENADVIARVDAMTAKWAVVQIMYCLSF